MNNSKYEYRIGLLGYGEAGQSIAKSLIKKFPNKKLDYPNFKNQPDLQFYY